MLPKMSTTTSCLFLLQLLKDSTCLNFNKEDSNNTESLKAATNLNLLQLESVVLEKRTSFQHWFLPLGTQMMITGQFLLLHNVGHRTTHFLATLSE